MRLTHIKLSGFKSFTDPTTIHVPGQLVAVIGPNGCGKSNVIDAVRWVLGEASAKQLRGESMQDVIFNGAATRRPAPRASVELVFDNSDHSLQGAWGQYAEVSIKRQLTRQGESTYFINNQTVRRRDITDLFLGTGVGARGYAVIEQGMISRIIEARPEELRAYIEEAAGVSKYKERRKETAGRLKANDSQRIERALEVYLLTGKPLSEHFTEQKQAAPLLDLCTVALIPEDRHLLHQQIEKRFLNMLEHGFLDEMHALRLDYPQLHADMPSMRCVGYRQAWDYLEGETDYDTFVEKGIIATRQLAKRQLTWSRKIPLAHTLDPYADSDYVQTALALARDALSE